MRLRNKKTGEVVESFKRGPIDLYFYPNEYKGGDDIERETYQSLAELNSEWEDYEPKEPLIKDEKIRKAVRAWAELIPSAQVRYDHSDGRFYTHSDYIVPYSISFPVILGLDETTDYTIAELCGEEEEQWEIG